MPSLNNEPTSFVSVVVPEDQDITVHGRLFIPSAVLRGPYWALARWLELETKWIYRDMLNEAKRWRQEHGLPND